MASLASGMAADLVTASALCYYLRQYKTGYSPADSMVTHLSRSAINTGIVTSGVSFATLLTYHFRPDDMIFIAEYFVLSKLQQKRRYARPHRSAHRRRTPRTFYAPRVKDTSAACSARLVVPAKSADTNTNISVQLRC